MIRLGSPFPTNHPRILSACSSDKGSIANWILSLAIFLAWVIGGIVRQPGFYDSVVIREFAGRFSETIHKPQPLYFYFPHLLHHRRTAGSGGRKSWAGARYGES